MPKIQQLINFIKSKEQCTYNEVKEKAFSICETWRESTWNRQLRSCKSIKAIKPINAITGYRWVSKNLEGLSEKTALSGSKSPLPNYVAKQNEEALKIKNSNQQSLL